MSIKKTLYGTTNKGEEVYLFEIKNSSGMAISLINYGATLDRIYVEDKNGKFEDVLIGFEDLEGHMGRSDYQGMTVGQCANRIAGGRFEIDGVEYNVTKNINNSICLHSNGEYSHTVWGYEILSDRSVKFAYTSPDGAEGFPANVDVEAVYSLTDDNEVVIEYTAIPDKTTVINLTNHAYFNLAGCNAGEITGHIMQINADYFSETDANSIPTGRLLPLKGTPLDFNEPRVIGEGIDDDFEQIKLCGGYDNNYCLRGNKGKLAKAAEVLEPVSGRILEVFTNTVGMQFYAGNSLNGALGKGGKPMNKRTGFCLETQFYPDSPNQPEFPSCIFRAGEEFRATTVFKFSVKK